jgi:hypothetical protein
MRPRSAAKFINVSETAQGKVARSNFGAFSQDPVSEYYAPNKTVRQQTKAASTKHQNYTIFSGP